MPSGQQAIDYANEAMKRQDWPEAVKRWLDMLAKYGDTSPPETFQKLAVAYRRLNKLDAAQSIIIRGLGIHPQSIDLQIEQAEVIAQQQDWPTALKQWQSIVDEFGGSTPEKVWVKLIHIQKHLKDFESAGRTARNSLKAHPKSSQLRLETARLDTLREDWPTAVKSWSLAAKDWSEKAVVADTISYATALNHTGNSVAAHTILTEALVAHPHDNALHVALAETVTQLGEWPRALRLWEELLKSSATLPVSVQQQARFNRSVLHRLVHLDTYKQQLSSFNRSRHQPKKIVIVTAFTIGYDNLKPPEILDERFDYVAYCDGEVDGMGIFDIRPLPEPYPDGGRAIRYVKTHPHTLFKDYDAVVWIDTSLMIVGDLYPLVQKFIHSGLPVGSGVHPFRTSIYEEYQACIDLKKGDPATLKRQIDFYKSVDFNNNDLAENGLLMFNPRVKTLTPAMEEWWQQICTFSTRDQLSFNYALSKHRAEWFRLTKPPHNLHNHPDVVIMPHHSSQIALEALKAAL